MRTTLLFAAVFAMSSWQSAAPGTVSDKPDTPFKLATVGAAGRDQLALITERRVINLAAANAQLSERAKLPKVDIPGDMRTLIEQYDRVRGRLYQIANYSRGNDLPAFGSTLLTYRAPIKYPWNIVAAAANYRAHAEGMGAAQGNAAKPATAPPPMPASGFNAGAAAFIVPDRDAPILFAKSPRSCIIDPNEAYYIPPGRDRIDWEGEMAIIMGKEALMVPAERAHDYVFGYSIMYDLSDRGGRQRQVAMFAGANWFDGKSVDRGAPFGPVIVPKEFIKDPENLRVVTKVNGEVVQDGNTNQFIWKEKHLIAYATSILTLFPGDVISSGTPAGTGAERQKFLKAGDVVTIEIEGIGTLTTPMKAWSERK
jgi:2-keto-4-pentenoate hydratase/2-oxohepta-3-ene-1,7-dioic acid hydratase in catechol pathway